MQPPRSDIKMPDFQWKQSACEVCGAPVRYLSKRPPHTCSNGECRYKYEYKIARETWAGFQPGLFDRQSTNGKA
jgi:hypothetical protein